MFFKLLFMVFLLGVLGCASNSQKVTRSKFNETQFQKLEKAFKLMEKKEFLKAGQLYDSLSMSSKDSSVRILSLYNAGLAYKSAGACETSLSRFRSVLGKSFKKLQEYQAISLMEISFVYECLGQNDSSLSSLKDLEGKLNFLTLNFQQILYPARLSMAWSRQGDFNKANKYQSLAFAQALKYKDSLQKESVDEEMSRLFYLMGKSYVKKEYLNAESFIFSFLYHQVFLLQSLFMKHENWSSQAKKELDHLFDKLVGSLSQTENKESYKKFVEKSLDLGASLIKKENSKEWKQYYDNQSKLVRKLFSHKTQKTNQLKRPKQDKKSNQTNKRNPSEKTRKKQSFYKVYRSDKFSKVYDSTNSYVFRNLQKSPFIYRWSSSRILNKSTQYRTDLNKIFIS